MRIFLDAGYPIEKAAICAAPNAAALVGLPRIGQFKENMSAMFIAVKGAPSQLPESVNQIKMIYNQENRKYR
jgi:hypothetical protein